MSDRLEQLRKLQAVDPNDADLPYMIALELVKAGETDDALAAFDQALSLNPNYHYAYFQKAKLLEDEGQTDDALQVLELGIRKADEASDYKALGELRELKQAIAG